MKKIFIAIAILIASVLTLYLDQFAFSVDNLYTSKLYLITKTIVLILLVFIAKNILKIYKKLKNRDTDTIKYTKIFVIYLAIYVTLILLTWPGLWIWDEFTILEGAKTLQLEYWQHYLSTIYYIFALEIIPIPAFVVVIQNIVIAIISTYVTYTIGKNYPKLSKIAYIPFLLLPTLTLNLYPMRLVIYAYIIIFIIVYIFFKHKDKGKLTLPNLLFLAILIAIISVWRTEGIIFLPTFSILISVLFRKNTTLKTQCIFIIAVFTLFLLISYPQNEKTKLSYEYKLTSFINPLANMLKKEVKTDNTEEDYQNINAVISIDKLKEQNTYFEIETFWLNRGEIRENLIKENYDNFIKSYINIVMHNPLTFIEVRMNTFMGTVGLYENRASSIAHNKLDDLDHFMTKDFLSSNINRPLNRKLRDTILNILTVRTDKMSSTVLSVNKVIWNITLPVILMILTAVITLIKRKPILFIYCMIGFMYSGIVFIFAPGAYFMYYFPLYLYSYILSLIVIGELNIKWGKQRRQK